MICQPSPWGLKFGTILASEIQIGHESSHHNWIVDHSEPLLTMIAVTTINHYQPLLAIAEPNHPFFHGSSAIFHGPQTSLCAWDRADGLAAMFFSVITWLMR